MRQNFFDRVTDKVVERMRASQKAADETDVVPVGMEEVSVKEARKRVANNIADPEVLLKPVSDKAWAKRVAEVK